jgi:hypothetical protein
MSELLPLGLGIKAGVKSTTGSMQVYADGTSGLDTNDGLTLGTPKKTLQAVFDMIPYYVKHNSTINLTGVFNDAADSTATLNKYVCSLLVIDGSSAMTVFNDNGGSNFTPDIFSVSSLGLTTAGWVADAYMGYMLEIVSGTCAGQTRMIQGNTATTLTPVRNFSVTPDATSVFRIVRPTTTLSTNAYPLFKNDGQGVMIVQRLYQASGQIYVLNAPGVHVFTHVVSMSSIGQAFWFAESGSIQFTASARHPTTYALQSATTNSQAGVSQIAYDFNPNTGKFGVYSISNLTMRASAGNVLKAAVFMKTTNATVGSGSRIGVMVVNGIQMNSSTPNEGITTATGYATTKFGGVAGFGAIQVINGSIGIGSKVEFVAGSKYCLDAYHSQLHISGCRGGAATDFGVQAKGGTQISIRHALRTGSNTTFAISGTTVTLTDSAGTFATTDVGQNINVRGATSPANDGDFVITVRLSATQVQYENAAGVSEAGAGTYYVGHPTIYGSTGDITVDGTTEETDWDTIMITGTPLVDATKQLVTAQKYQLTGFNL